ncbi:MAG: hypothetical protein A2664_02800 [Candidatus Taylorbacteria bacterium RIFCSPHIGHO2_01_FULL_46_22b]|uniref:DNA polymerase III subunit delta n=1 Tax=Candidatus Taylorbacteria bacterium RIFCSPHIGHO2_01_FULL_46_22b TaxID=1802301 RepID=A0A1G2M655_9BACT|nr:MAG: hypothetical protein A2664_02800 [Candidatus Taylorbacteria bacterium RIFCSPHIGHO2_01_FULL_46_22b]
MYKDMEKTTLSRIGKQALELHHAYLIIGEHTAVLADVLAFLQEVVKAEVRGNPDMHISRFDNFSVDDARRLRTLAGQKAFGPRKIFVLSFSRATSESQNALLKLLEDPFSNTHFFILVPSSDTVLPTLRSRLFIIDEAPRSASNKEARSFIDASIPERLELVKTLATSVSEGETDKQSVITLVSGIELVLWEEKGKKKIPISVFDDIALCRKYLSDQSASIKMLLEHLALVLPASGR